VLDTGTPVVLVMLTGRPYAVEWALDRCAAVVQAFFPGEAGGAAVAGVLSGRVNPSGRLPVTVPRSAGAQPYSYLHPRLGGASSVSNLATAPPLPFGHGLSYTTFAYGDLQVLEAEVDAGGSIRVTVDVSNTGDRAGTEVVQLYGHDVVASITRPVAQLLAYARVDLAPGEHASLELTVPTTRLAFSDRQLRRIVEPGAIELWIGRSWAERVTEAEVTLVGGIHEVQLSDPRWSEVKVNRATDGVDDLPPGAQR
jgi:beta-glucosidase